MSYRFLPFGLTALLIALIISAPGIAFSGNQSIDIPYFRDAPVIDGKWTGPDEWSNASEDELTHTDTGFSAVIRTMHDGNSLFFMVDFVDDESHDTAVEGAMICIDTKHDGGMLYKTDDYCFGVVEDYFQGYRSSIYVAKGSGEMLTTIQNPAGYFAYPGFSSINDPYQSGRPHRLYEFGIPLTFVGVSDNYGLYIIMRDRSTDVILHWPPASSYSYGGVVGRCGQGLPVWLGGGGSPPSYLCPPNPDNWGRLISPDKSIPEFPLPIVALTSMLGVIIIITRKKMLRKLWSMNT